MSENLTDEARLLSLSLKDIFPLCDVSPSRRDKDRVVNAAYKKLFRDLIPGFNKGEVHFVLAEVLELDREESRPRILVYSDRRKKGVEDLLDEYFKVIGSLREDEWSISKTDALYTSSRIWCAETHSAECPVKDDKKRWVITPGDPLARSYEFENKVAEKEEVEEIRVAFIKYINALYELHLKNYPFAYVMLIPIFLGSMYEEKKRSRKKLGAIFLHFATTKGIDDDRILLRLYSRTLLFWHYYFTSEAIDKRQSLLDESDREKKSLKQSNELFNKINPHINDIRRMLRDLRGPLESLEAELDPVPVVLLGENLSHFFRTGRPIYVLEQEVMPKHDWFGGSVEVYKKLVAGVMVTAFRLEGEVEPPGDNLWAQVSGIIQKRAGESPDPMFRELLRSLPHLSVREPDERQVEATFRVLKSWYSDAYKVGSGIPGMPVSMLELVLRVWGCDYEPGRLDAKSFWVASQFPARTINALANLHGKHRLLKARLSVEMEDGLTDTITTCSIRLALERSHSEVSGKGASLERLRHSLGESVDSGIPPGGDTTRFLWTIGGQRRLNLNGTVFSWKGDNCDFSLDFIEADGRSKEMLINWKGEINA